MIFIKQLTTANYPKLLNRTTTTTTTTTTMIIITSTHLINIHNYYFTRVIADHIRTLSFSITDGAVPDSASAGFVLRRILRRAVRYGQEILGLPVGFLTRLAPAVVEHFGSHFTELKRKGNLQHLQEVLTEEEHDFTKCFESGLKRFQKIVKETKARGEKMVNAGDAFFLWDTKGNDRNK